ncbi:MAG: cold shock domain-containing protein [Actinomycetota bacterium]|nr:cold shock domain-containing protein [Actinomycetota bacterium]
MGSREFPPSAGDVFAHFSNIVGDGRRALSAGEPVRFEWEAYPPDRTGTSSARHKSCAGPRRAPRRSVWSSRSGSPSSEPTSLPGRSNRRLRRRPQTTPPGGAQPRDPR